MVPKTAGEYFGAIVEEYDSRMRRGLPRYEEMLRELVRSLPAAAEDILELGCGTGALTLLLAERYPSARLTLVDAAPEMLDLTRDRLADAFPDVRASAHFIVSTFEDLDLTEQRYDCITASMSLHHIADKGPFYRKLHFALRRGAALVFADELTGAVDYTQELHWNDWLEFARLPGHLTEDEIGEIIEHVEELDYYETLPRQLELLAAAGFSTADCVWRSGNYAIFVGT